MKINTENRLLRTLLWLLLFVYFLVLLKMIIFKWSFPYMKEHFEQRYGWDSAKSKLRQINYIPFHTVHVYLVSKDNEIRATKNLLGNIAGFIPLGILLPLLFRRLRSASQTILTTFLVSLGFETCQLLIQLGYFDIDDLLLNTLGGAIGYLLFLLLQKSSAVK